MTFILKYRFLCVLIGLIISSNIAKAESVLSFFPDTSYTTINSSVLLKANISNVDNLFAVAFDIVYDTNYIQFDSIKEGNFINENGTVSTSFIYNSQPGRIIVAISRMNYTLPGVSTVEDTTLVNVYFSTLNYGWTNIEFENVGLMDPDLTSIPFIVQNGIIDIMGPPVIDNIPDTSFYRGDTLNIYLNNFVNDPDTPDSLLNWEILQADFINYNLDPEKNLLSLNSSLWTGNTYIVLQVTDPNEYFDIDTFNVKVSLPVRISKFYIDNKQEPDFIVYPNPFKDNTTIRIYNTDTEFTFNLFSVDGQLMKSNNYKYKKNKSFITLNYSVSRNIPNGIYFIKLVSNNKIITKKIIIN